MDALGALARASTTAKTVAAGVSGVLLVLALPKPDLYPLAWIALVPLLLTLSVDAGKMKTFALGYAMGIVYFGGTCYWIVSTMATYGGLSIAASAGVFALFVAVFSLHTALFAMLLRFEMAHFGAHGLLLAAPTWVAVELLQTYLVFGGFPWMLAGYALSPYRGLLQAVTWTGVYGLSFVLVAVSSLFALGWSQWSWRPTSLAVLMVAIAFWIPAPGTDPPEDPFSVRVVQTDIDIDHPWQSPRGEQLLDDLHTLSISDSRELDLIVWPETPSPFFLGQDADFQYRMGNIARTLDAHFLIGYIDFIGEAPSNSAGLLSPSGEQISRYNKIHLVPFGEYVPLKDLLFFAGSLVRNVGDFAPGTEFTLSSIDGHTLATTICYEDVFPGLIRQFTKRGAEVIVNITNDGWFGSTSAPYQHLRMAAVRAVENRRYIVRGANSGITAIIDPYGNILSQTELGERTLLDGVAGYRSDLTFYVRFGDLFAYAMTLLTAIALWVSWTKRRKGSMKQAAGR